RSIVVSSELPPTIVAPGSAIPQQFNGQALLSSSAISAGAFDYVSLESANVTTPGSTGLDLGLGSIVLESGVSLSPRMQLTLDAPYLSLQGSGDVSLSSAVVRIGASGNPQRVLDAPTGGNATLRVQASLVELFGNLAVSGTSSTRLASSG